MQRAADVESLPRLLGELSGVTARKEVDDPIYIRCVADMTLLELKVNIFLNSFNLNGQSGASGQVIDDSAGGR